QRCTRHPDRIARWLDSDFGRELLRALHHDFSNSSSFGGSSSIPKSSDSFFWTRITFSACSSFRRRRWFSRSRFATRRASVDGAFFGPCLRPMTSSVLVRACALQVVNRDEYRPSRRSSAPTSPGSRHASAAATILRLYASVNFRRLGLGSISLE